MCISSKRHNVNLSFSLANNILNQSHEIKDLGVVFDSKLSFSSHISGIIGKAKQRLFLLNKCFLTKDPDILILAYKTYVLPLFDYCSQILSPYQSTGIA